MWVPSIVPLIVITIIVIQFYFFLKNLHRMNEFMEIFGKDSQWTISKNISGFVSGIEGEGNSIFVSIKDSINMYLEKNSGSVIDFHLLKDAVDRHCDSVENDVNVQIPLPLYCGLVGTMSGVIVGLYPLLSSGALIYLLSGKLPIGVDADTMNIYAAEGINELLSGVAWAMSASICGIILTTLNSFLFKSCKLKEEYGKNCFLAWMQSCLLPELPTDTSDALNRLVKNLNTFNRIFSENTTRLSGAFDKVNSSYKIQAEVIKAVHDMDVMKMAKVNVRVLEELQKSTDKLEQFNEYLSCVKGYTETIKTFTELFDSESERLHVLEEIKEFFNRHKAEIAQDVTDSDVTLKDSLRLMKTTTAQTVNDFKTELVTQTQTLKDVLRQEKEAFEKLNIDLKNQFSEELSKTPTLIKNIEAISKIPPQLDELLKKIDNQNTKLHQNLEKKIIDVISKTRKVETQESSQINPNVFHKEVLFPKWLNWVIAILLFLIMVACVTNTAYTIVKGELVINNAIPTQNASANNDNKEILDSVLVDSVISVSSDSIN